MDPIQIKSGGYHFSLFYLNGHKLIWGIICFKFKMRHTFPSKGCKMETKGPTSHQWGNNMSSICSKYDITPKMRETPMIILLPHFPKRDKLINQRSWTPRSHILLGLINLENLIITPHAIPKEPSLGPEYFLSNL